VNPSPIYDFDEFYRSFAPNMRVWGYNGYVTGKDRLMFQPWWFATHRYGGFTWFSTFGGVIRKHGLSTPWNLIDIPSGALTVDAEQLKQSLEESELLTGMGKLFLEYEWSKRAIAIYYSHESMLTSFCLGKENRNGIIDPDGPMHDFYFSRHQLRYQLEEMLFQYDFVAPEQVTRGKLEEYKVLFMPRIIALADDEINALKNFLAKGGRIIADILPGAYDELGIRRQQNPLDGLKNIHLTGSNFSDKDPRQCADMHALLSESGLSKILHSSISPSLAGREAMHFCKGQMNVFVILHNPVRGAAESDAQIITLPEKGHLYDLREGRYLGHTDKCQILLTEKFPAAVFGCYPYEVTGLQVDSPRSLKAGADLCLELAVQSSEGSPGPHLMHLALTDPAGNSRFHLKRNLVAENGKANLRMRMAFNDSKGQWQLLVKDVMTGMTATRKFSVE
ncbi:MAG: hypothetical protein PHT43_06630, partial [Anaerolineaceae bacterium]|nr:hypothetical protein [Anaerolineaceae bacterium]